MYSSSRRGRSPASYCASSSTRAAVTIADRRGSLLRSSRSACFSVSSKRRRASERLHRRVHGFFGERPMIPQVHQRREQIVAQRPARPARRRRRPRPRLRARQPILQLEHDPLGGLLADAGNGREPRRGRRARSPDSSGGSMPDSTASASFGPIPLTPISRSNRSCSSSVAKPYSSQRVLADVRVDAQRDARCRARRGRRTWTAARTRRSRRRGRRRRCGWDAFRESCPRRCAITAIVRASGLGDARLVARLLPPRWTAPSRASRGTLRVHVADGDRERIGRVVRRRHGGEAEQQLHHLLHLRACRRGRSRRPRV